MLFDFKRAWERSDRSGRYQFVWWGWRNWRFGLAVFDESKTDLAKIYRWSVNFGPVDLRKWARRV